MEMKVSRVGCFQTKGHWICYSTFSNISFMVFLTRLLSKCLWRNHPLQFKFQKPVLRCSMLQKIKMPNFAILKWRPFEYKVKSRKLGPFLECFFRKKNADILNFSWIRYFGIYFSFLMKWHIWVCYSWNYGPPNLTAELKEDFWLQIDKSSKIWLWTFTSDK